MNNECVKHIRLKSNYKLFKSRFNRLITRWNEESEKVLNPKSTLKITKFIHNTQSKLKFLPLGHRWRGDVQIIKGVI